MRRLIAIQVLAALLPALLAAPFLHVHKDAGKGHVLTSHRDQVPAVHTHLAAVAKAGGGSRLEQDSDHNGEDAVGLRWTPDQPGPVAILAVLPVGVAAISVPDQVAGWMRAQVSRAHSPPFVFAQNPRPPPA